MSSWGRKCQSVQVVHRKEDHARRREKSGSTRGTGEVQVRKSQSRASGGVRGRARWHAGTCKAACGDVQGFGMMCDIRERGLERVRARSLLMSVSRLPKSPPWMRCLNLRIVEPPMGLEGLNGQRKFAACWKVGPAVKSPRARDLRMRGCRTCRGSTR